MRRGRGAAVACVVVAALLGGCAEPSVDEPQVPAPDVPLIPDEVPLRTPLRFGVDAPYAARAGAEVGTMWIGPWNQVHGWNVPMVRAHHMQEHNVTPAYHLYYWGDDLDPACFRDGCMSSLHGVWKDQAGWAGLVQDFVAFLERSGTQGEVIVYLETEFNRHEVRSFEPLDAALATHARTLHNSSADVKVVLSLGNWNPQAWPTWDRAVAASDAIGVQAVRGSTRHDPAAFDLAEATLAGVRAAKELAKLPIMVHDVAVASYPPATHEALQEQALRGLFDDLPALKAAGVVAITYRSWKDDPSMDTHNTFGTAERHWGLHHADGSPKPAAAAWEEAVAKERRDPA